MKIKIDEIYINHNDYRRGFKTGPGASRSGNQERKRYDDYGQYRQHLEVNIYYQHLVYHRLQQFVLSHQYDDVEHLKIKIVNFSITYQSTFVSATRGLWADHLKILIFFI